MIKKLLVTVAALTMTGGVAFAAPYVGVSTGVTTNTSSNGGSYRGVPATLFAGYGATVSPSIYLGGEIFGTLGNGTLDNNGVVKTTSGYGASFIPGLMLSDHTLAYARLGVIDSHFSQLNRNALGGQIGLGLQTSLTQCVDVRGEYTYTQYKSVSGISSTRSDQATVGLIYKFE